MTVLVAPETLRARWAMAIPAEERACVAQIEAIAANSKGVIWRPVPGTWLAPRGS